MESQTHSSDQPVYPTFGQNYEYCAPPAGAPVHPPPPGHFPIQPQVA